jgi:hypothetical protein
MKPVIAISIEHYETLLKRATEDSPLYFRLKNAVKMASTVVIPCDLEQAEMLLQVANTVARTLYRRLNERSNLRGIKVTIVKKKKKPLETLPDEASG